MKRKSNNNYIGIKTNGEYFIPLCGTQEVGCNANIARVNYNGKTEQIIIDAGLGMLKDYAGIDHCIPDYTCIDPKVTVGIVITHAHLDHFGSLTYLLRHLKSDVNVYATKFTMYIIQKKLQESGIQANLITVEMNSVFSIGEFFDIQLIGVTHSVPETQMVTITYKPSGIRLLHTADYKIDADPVIGHKTNEDLLTKMGIKGINYLVSDSTNSNQIDWSFTEQSAQDGLRKLINDLEGYRIVASCFSSNIARISSLLQIAKESGRKVLLVGKSMHRMIDAARHCGYITDELDAYIASTSPGTPESKLMVICTGSQAEPGSVLHKLAECGSYNPVQLNPNNKIKTAVIFSARIIPGRTLAIEELKAKLMSRGALICDTFEHKSIHVSGHPSRPELEFICDLIRGGNGHNIRTEAQQRSAASPSVTPRTMNHGSDSSAAANSRPPATPMPHGIPVHGSQLLLRHAMDLFKRLGMPCTMPHNGVILKLVVDSRGNTVEIVGDVHVRRIGLDGKKLKPIDLNSSCIQSRKEIGKEGVISICYDNHKLISVHSLGCLPPQITQSDMFIDIIKRTLQTARNDATIAHKLKQMILVKYGKNPGIILHNMASPLIFKDRSKDIDDVLDDNMEEPILAA